MSNNDNENNSGDNNETNSALGRLVRLRLLTPDDIPPHPVLAESQHATTNDSTPPVSLRSFVNQVLAEGSEFTDKTIPQTFKSTSTKSSPPSSASVKSSARKISASEILNGVKDGKWGFAQSWQDEFWFARQSVHRPQEETGTASWKEFVNGLLRDHSVHEADYTPNVFDCRLICDWDEQLNGMSAMEGHGYEEVRMSIYEMVHHIPFPLCNRVFSTLVVSAIDTARTGTDSFVLVQIPIDLTSVPTAAYSTGKHRREGHNVQQKKRVVLGQYVSVERCRIENGDQNSAKIVWDMATASDAKGWLPMAVQKLGVPGAVVKDVGFFMKWVAQRRGRGEPKATSGGPAS